MCNFLNNAMNATVFGLIAFVVIYLCGDNIEIVKNADPTILFGAAIAFVGICFAAKELFNFNSSFIK